MGRTAALRLVSDDTAHVEALSAADGRLLHFCSHCAAPAVTPEATSRVCADCGLGVILRADSAVAPGPGAAFVVVDRSMSICALSCEAERRLEIAELRAVNRHLTELLIPADIDAGGRGALAFAIAAAVHGETAPRRCTLRPANLFGVRLSATIVPCGPRPAALVALS